MRTARGWKHVGWKMLAIAAGLLVLTALVPGQAQAANYPTRPVTFVVPWAAGGDTDVLMRIFAEHMGKYLGQPMVVVNKPGASGAIGAREVIAARPDGYTLLAGNDSIALGYAMGMADFTYFDLEPIGLITSTPHVVATHSDNPWNSFAEVVEYARANPGKIRFGATFGSTTQLLPAALIAREGLDIRVVGYDGTGPRTNALLGKHIDLGETSLAAGLEYVKSGHLKLLAVTTEERDPAVPDLPTLREQGIDFVFAANRGVFAPKGTPMEIIRIIEDAMRRLAEDEDFRAEVEALGTRVRFLDREAYSEYLRNTLREYDELVKALEM